VDDLVPVLGLAADLGEQTRNIHATGFALGPAAACGIRRAQSSPQSPRETRQYSDDR
jgi:hypothetical protein